MAILTRDPVTTPKRLGEWLSARFPERGGATVPAIDVPPGTGFSGETLLFDVHWGDGTVEPLVAKVEPTTHTVFWHVDFKAQYQVMAALDASTDVPMPVMLGYEADASLIGAAFSVMKRVDGAAPPDAPPYTAEGFVVDASPQQQRRMVESSIAAMAQVHGVDWKALGLDVVDRRELGVPPGLDQELAYCEGWWAWASELEGGSENPVIERTWEWIRANRPVVDDAPVALCWGDSRPGNQLFHDFEVVAVLDWEMVALGDPRMDLGWWTFLDRFHEVQGPQRLPGFPDREEIVARWSSLTGRSITPEQWQFFEIFAGLRFGIVMVRLATLFQQNGFMPAEATMDRDNPVLTLTSQLLDDAGA